MNSPVRSIAQLRKEAEAILRENPASAPVLKTADVQKLLHELQVYETELEIQNEDLRKAQIEIVESRDRFAELYDFAPVGYLTLDGETCIMEANLTAVKMFGFNRSEIKNGRIQFSGIVSSESQDDWYRFRRRMFVGDEKQSCELDCCYGDGPALRCQVESTVIRGAGSGDRCMVAILDISSRKKAQDALQSSNKLINALVTHDGLLIADAQGRITEMNNAALAMFGFGAKEDMLRVMSGEAKVMDLTDPEGKDLSIGQIPINRVCAGETFSGEEFSVYVRPTKRRWYGSFSGAPVLDDTGRIEYVVLTIRDISEKKQAEWAAQTAHELAENKMTEAVEYRNRLDAVMQTLPVGIAILDAQGGHVSANAAFDDIWGRPRPDISTIGDHAKYKATWVDSGKTVLPEEWASARALRKGETVTGQILCIEGFDGAVRFVHNSAAPILDAHGEVAGCAVAIQDITLQIVSEKAIRESEERYRHLVQYAPAGIYDVDFATGRFTEVNDVMCRVLGYRRDELLSMTAFDILDDEGKALFASRVRKAQAGERPGESSEYRVRTKSGRLIWALLNVTFRWKGEHVAGAMVVAHDITERKQMEEKLQTTLLRFYLILSNMHFGVLLVTNENRVEFVNQAFCDFFGLKDSPDDLAKLSASEMIDKIRPSYKDPDAAVARIREIVDAGLPLASEEIVMGGDRTFLRDFTPIRVGEETFGRLWVHADITERKRAEDALRESELRFKSLYLSMSEGLATHEIVYSDEKATDYIITDVNPAFERITGLDRSASVGKKASVLYGTGSPPFLDLYARVAESGVSEHFETPFPPMKKHFAISAFSPGKGKFATVFSDITERKKAEEALHESEERFKVLSETSSVGIGVVTSLEATFLYVNPAYEKAFGYSPGELLGRKSPDIWWNPAERERVVAILKETGTIADYEVRLKRKDGSMFWGLASNRPITYNGRPALLGTFVDITDRKKAEEELARHMEELRVSNDELARFNRVAVDRELRMIELKKQVNGLCGKAGMEPMYKVEGEESTTSP